MLIIETNNLPGYPKGLLVIFLYLLYAPKTGKTSSKFFFNSDFEKLVTISPEQGFKQVEVSTIFWSIHSRSAVVVQIEFYNDGWHYGNKIKMCCMK